MSNIEMRDWWPICKPPWAQLVWLGERKHVLGILFRCAVDSPFTFYQPQAQPNRTQPLPYQLASHLYSILYNQFGEINEMEKENWIFVLAKQETIPNHGTATNVASITTGTTKHKKKSKNERGFLCFISLLLLLLLLFSFVQLLHVHFISNVKFDFWAGATSMTSVMETHGMPNINKP